MYYVTYNKMNILIHFHNSKIIKLYDNINQILNIFGNG